MLKRNELSNHTKRNSLAYKPNTAKLNESKSQSLFHRILAIRTLQQQNPVISHKRILDTFHNKYIKDLYKSSIDSAINKEIKFPVISTANKEKCNNRLIEESIKNMHYYVTTDTGRDMKVLKQSKVNRMNIYYNRGKSVDTNKEQLLGHKDPHVLIDFESRKYLLPEIIKIRREAECIKQRLKLQYHFKAYNLLKNQQKFLKR